MIAQGFLMDLGLTPQQRIILRRARAEGLQGAEGWQVLPPLWSIAGISLAPLLLIPEWALELREI